MTAWLVRMEEDKVAVASDQISSMSLAAINVLRVTNAFTLERLLEICIHEQKNIWGSTGVEIKIQNLLSINTKSKSIVIHGLNFHDNVLDMAGTQLQTVVQVVQIRNTMKIIQENKVYLINKIETLKLGSGHFELYIDH